MNNIAHNRLEEEVIIKKVKEYGMIYLGREYIKKKNKRPTLFITCMDNDGYKYRLYYSTIRKKNNANPFRGSNIYAMENISKYLKKNNLNIVCLGLFVKNQATYGKFKCLLDGYVWNTKIHNIVNIHTGCPYCKKNVIITSELANEEFKKNGIKFKIINKEDDEKIKVHDRILVKCMNCGFIFETCLNTIRITNQTCKKCCQDFGVYTIKSAEKHKDTWSNVNGLLYVIKCTSNYSNECFYKIGITKNSVKARFSWNKNGRRIPYDYEILYEIKNNLYDCIYLERKLHKLNTFNKYVPEKKFGGHTECFIKLSKEVVECILENI